MKDGIYVHTVFSFPFWFQQDIWHIDYHFHSLPLFLRLAMHSITDWWLLSSRSWPLSVSSAIVGRGCLNRDEGICTISCHLRHRARNRRRRRFWRERNKIQGCSNISIYYGIYSESSSLLIANSTLGREEDLWWRG